MYEYCNLLLEEKKADNILICMSQKDKYFKDYIYYKAYELGYNNIDIFYYDENKDLSLLKENTTVLVLVSDNLNNTAKAIIDVYPDVTIGYLPNNRKFENLDNKKYNNFNSKELIIKDMCDIDLKVKNVKNKEEKIIEVPKYGLNIDGNVNGFIRLNKIAKIKDVEIKDLVLEIKNNKINDYDCASNKELMKKIIDTAYLDKLYITGVNNPFYNSYDDYKNMIDKYKSSFISFDSEYGKLIAWFYGKTLKVYDEKKLVYDKEKILIK